MISPAFLGASIVNQSTQKISPQIQSELTQPKPDNSIPISELDLADALLNASGGNGAVIW
jgi:hypothetical protein